MVHYAAIEQAVEQISETYELREVAFDRWGAVQMTQNLDAMGLTVVPFGQGFKDMNPPTLPGTSNPTKKNPPRRSTAWWPLSWASTSRLDAAVDPPLRVCMTEEAYFSCNVNLRVTSGETL